MPDYDLLEPYMTLNPIVAKVTERIIARSRDSRTTYLDLIDRQRDEATVTDRAEARQGR